MQQMQELLRDGRQGIPAECRVSTLSSLGLAPESRQGTSLFGRFFPLWSPHLARHRFRPLNQPFAPSGALAPDDGIADATAEDQIDPSHQLRLVPHVIASFGRYSPLHESRDELTMDRLSMIDGIEGFLFRVGRWSEAYRMRIFYFRKTEKMLGKEHPDTLRSMKNLAEVLSSQGKFEEVEEMHGQALALTETVLGKEHPSTLTSVYCLVYLLHQKKRYKDAEVFYHRAYAGYRKTLGERHPTTAVCLRHYSLMLKEEKG